MIKQAYHILDFNVFSPVRIENLKNPTDKEKFFFDLVSRVNDFGMQELGFVKNKNYRTYSRKNPKMYMLTASKKSSFTSYSWNFPFFGRSPYLGFYDLEDLKKEIRRLERHGFETYVSQISAFSTLGILKDPLFEYMMHDSEESIAELLLHEQFHSTLWIKGEFQLNENLANFIGKKASRLFMEKYAKYSQGEKANLEKDIEKQNDYQSYRNFFNHVYKVMDEFYKRDDLSVEEKLSQRDAIYSREIEKLKKNYDKYFVLDDYKFIFDMKLNNAYLSLFKLYNSRADKLEKVYNYFGKDLVKMIKYLKGLDRRELKKDLQRIEEKM